MMEARKLRYCFSIFVIMPSRLINYSDLLTDRWMFTPGTCTVLVRARKFVEFHVPSGIMVDFTTEKSSTCEHNEGEFGRTMRLSESTICDKHTNRLANTSFRKYGKFLSFTADYVMRHFFYLVLSTNLPNVTKTKSIIQEKKNQTT